MSASTERLLVVSNRSPYAVRRRGRATELVRTVGGLASTLDDALRRRGGVWLAWSGTSERPRRGSRRAPSERVRSLLVPDGGYRLRLINLTENEVAGYYHGFANSSLWPLCHYFLDRAHYDEDEWRTYEAVNRRFARLAVASAPARGLTWVHDYHLALVPALLRAQRSDVRIAGFWHIPFPPPAVFRVNRRARELVQGLLGSDLIGFHTYEYARHFLECAETLAGAEVNFDAGEARLGRHTTRVGSFPLGADAKEFAQLGADRRVVAQADEIRRAVGCAKLILGVDRLDYTKGILERLQAFERVLAEDPSLHGRVCFLQIQVPSRETVAEYRALRRSIEHEVGRICGRFSRPDWVPVRYIAQGFGRRELTAYYRAADVIVVTPLRDGMNLVAHEYVAARVDGEGVLVLSEFAGAAERLREALLVNPYDVESIADAIRTALHLPAHERRAAMRSMRQRVIEEDVDWWLGWFLAVAQRGEPRRRRRSWRSTRR